VQAIEPVELEQYRVTRAARPHCAGKHPHLLRRCNALFGPASDTEPNKLQSKEAVCVNLCVVHVLYACPSLWPRLCWV
jgi:hypothetical protein